MVSQSSAQRDSPVDPLEGVSNDSGDTDGSPGLLDTGHLPCQSDIKFTRHRAPWINPQGVQGQDLPLQVPTLGNSGSLVVRGAASPLATSPSSPEDSVVETSLWKNTAGSLGSSGEQSSDSAFISMQELAALPGRCPPTSLFPSCTMSAASPSSEAGSACLKPPHLTPSTGAGKAGEGLPSCLPIHTPASSWSKGRKPASLSSSGEREVVGFPLTRSWSISSPNTVFGQPPGRCSCWRQAFPFSFDFREMPP